MTDDAAFVEEMTERVTEDGRAWMSIQELDRLVALARRGLSLPSVLDMLSKKLEHDEYLGWVIKAARDHRADACAVPHGELDDALAALDATEAKDE